MTRPEAASLRARIERAAAKIGHTPESFARVSAWYEAHGCLEERIANRIAEILLILVARADAHERARGL